MPSGRTVVELAAHLTWTIYSATLFAIWRFTSLRQRFLSSKGQDRWIVTQVFPGMRGGFFVEAGAGNGFVGSDSFVLERDYGWHGICIEPNPKLFWTLRRVVRRRCVCVRACIDRHAGTVDYVMSGDTSGIIAADTDNSTSMRAQRLARAFAENRTRRLKAVPLSAILDQHGAPPVIDYLSLDIEGAEQRVLESFPFERYTILALTVERPTPVIHETLTKAGLVLQRQHWNDGFYVHRRLLPETLQRVPPKFVKKQF